MPRNRKEDAGTSSRSNRRKTREQRQVVQAELVAESEENEDVEAAEMEENENVEAEASEESESEHEQVDEIYPGGPTDKCLLKSFKFHRAYKIWETQATDYVKCVSHGKKTMSWPGLEENEPGYVPLFHQLIANSGLNVLAKVSYLFLSKILITAFVERWQPETNSFHLPFGEMTITLDDVASITGLSVIGRMPTNDTKLSSPELQQLAVRWLGVSKTQIANEVGKNNCAVVRLEWLKNVCSKISTRASVNQIEQSARAYLLYMLGCTIFSDKTGTKVSLRLLTLLTDLSNVHTYAWGAAALAYLYRQLGMASRVDTAQMSGYLTLLQGWIFEYFPTFRQHRNMHYTLDTPRAMRWCPSKEDGNMKDNLRDFRERLDILKASEVIWTPYSDTRNYHPFNEVAFFIGMLKCMQIVEPYHPNRVLRQLGYVQTIPRAPFEPVRGHRGRNAMTYSVTYNFLHQYFEGWDNHILSINQRGNRTRVPYEVSPDYIEWFRRVSHVIVQNPAYRAQYDPETEIVTGDFTAHVYQQSLPIVDHAYDEGPTQSSSSMWNAVESLHHVFQGGRLNDMRQYFRRNRRGGGN